MENTQKQYKRQDRSVSPETRRKISQALSGRPKSSEHRQAISNGLRADTGGYWSHIKPAPKDDGGNGGWPTDLVEENNGD